MTEVDYRYIAFENDHTYLKTTNNSDVNCQLLQTSISTIEPKHNAAVSSKTQLTRKQQNKFDINKTTQCNVNSDIQNSSVFLLCDTLNFPLSTDFKISQNKLPFKKIITSNNSSTRPIQPKLKSTSNIVPTTQTQSNTQLISSQINPLKTNLQNITSKNTYAKPNKQQLKPFIKPIKSIKNKIVYDYKNNTCTIELATNLCQRLLNGENIFMCRKCDKIFTEHKDLLDHYMIHDDKCKTTNLILQEKDQRELIPIDNVKKENKDVGKKIINNDKNISKQTIPVIKSALNSKKNKVIFQGECIMCHSVFPDLGEHIRTIHHSDLTRNKVNIHRCTICGMEFDIKQQLRAHELSAHKFTNTHTCEHCLKYFLCKEDLETHIESHCGDMKYLCPYCDAGFSNSNGLRTHLISHISFDSPEYSTSETPVNQIEYSPIRPPEQFDHLFSELDNVSEDSDNVYIEQVDDNNYQVSFFKDNEDNTNTSSQRNLLIDDGYEIDTELNNIPSEDNNKVIINEQQASLLNKKRISYTVCRICLNIVSYSRIGRHMKKKHNSAAPYQCEICHAEFNRKHIMDDHRRKHTNNKPHKCIECSKCFTYKHHLNRHMMIVHNSDTLEKVFKCSVCDKAFLFKEYLTLHVNSRHKGKHYMCQVCGKSFSTNASLNKHQLCHTDERPFMCEHCGRTFKCKTHCDTHKKNMHPGDHELTVPPEKFECELCKKLFSTKVYRDMHLKRHNGQGHQCDICYKLFVSKAHMQRHIKIMHRNT